MGAALTHSRQMKRQSVTSHGRFAELNVLIMSEYKKLQRAGFSSLNRAAKIVNDNPDSFAGFIVKSSAVAFVEQVIKTGNAGGQ